MKISIFIPFHINRLLSKKVTDNNKCANKKWSVKVKVRNFTRKFPPHPRKVLKKIINAILLI